eukprot:10997176-Karenia_brevis.AAC.1
MPLGQHRMIPNMFIYATRTAQKEPMNQTYMFGSRSKTIRDSSCGRGRCLVLIDDVDDDVN